MRNEKIYIKFRVVYSIKAFPHELDSMDRREVWNVLCEEMRGESDNARWRSWRWLCGRCAFSDIMCFSLKPSCWYLVQVDFNHVHVPWCSSTVNKGKQEEKH